MTLTYVYTIHVCNLGAEVSKEGDTTGNRFRYPSYVQDIMG